jgi:pSer/pThr/pTyr-binding forkhead associated (FHA) protein
VIVGRGAAVKGIDLAMHGSGERHAVDAVSRAHLMMRLTNAGAANWRLSVTDLNSTNGTMVQRWAGSDFDSVQQLAPEREVHLGTRDRVVLGESVLLRLSGKRYLAEPTTFDPGPARADLNPSATAITRQAAVPAPPPPA